MTEATLSLRRRQLLAGSAGAIAAAGLGGFAGTGARPGDAGVGARRSGRGRGRCPRTPRGRDANSVIVHSAQTIETRRSAYGTSIVTPAEQLYVRNNLPPPGRGDRRQSRRLVGGDRGVRNPRTLTVADLKTMGVETVAMVLQCSGNGRSYFPSKPSGTPVAGRRRRLRALERRAGPLCRRGARAASPPACATSPAPAARRFPTASIRSRSWSSARSRSAR
jgi:sulfite dehydrogenase